MTNHLSLKCFDAISTRSLNYGAALTFMCAALLACNKASTNTFTTTSAESPAPQAEQVRVAATPQADTLQKHSAQGEVARVGEQAPDFELQDTEGVLVTLNQFAGKRVVLEWFNPECPFVDAAHTSGSLVKAAADAQNDGVVWLAINSAAPGRNGHGRDLNRAAATRYNMKHPVLLDETGQVGRRYGATNTPHIFVIDEHATLVYAGAVDNSPDGEGATPKDGVLVSYVKQVLSELKAGQPISVSDTKAYGCGVKY